MIFSATGHRPPKLGGYDDKTFRKLTAFAQNFLSNDDVGHVITGMALGWDMAVAQAAINLNIPFTAAVPFDGQEKQWPANSQFQWRHLCAHAQKVVVVTPGPYLGWKLQKRNEWMVDRADMVFALWDGSSGGTYNCVVYAKRKGKPVVNLWEQWEKFR